MRVFCVVVLAMFAFGSTAHAVETAIAKVRFGGELTHDTVLAAGVPVDAVASSATVFDSFTTADTYTSTTSVPHTYMAMPFNLAGLPDGALVIDHITVYMVSVAAVSFTDVHVRMQFWDQYSGTNDPVFSNASGDVVDVDIGPLDSSASVYYMLDIDLSPPIALNGLANHGVAINYQADSGSGLVDETNFESLLRYGATGFAVGTPPFTGYGYRNSSGRTDFNFSPSEGKSFGQMNQGVALKMTGFSTDVIFADAFEGN